MDVSTIIVNWNTCEILRNCLVSIFASTKDVEFEVIVIDNASSDGSVDMVKSEFPQVEIIVNTENRGFAAANNQGITIARGRYVLLLNSDTVVLDNAIDEAVAFADTHPEAAVVGCRVLSPDRSLQPTCFMFPSLLNHLLFVTYLYKLFPRSKLFGREQMTWWNRDKAKEVDVVTGCFMLVRKTAIKQVGEMDTRFFMYAEETDWCYRFRKAGWKNMFTPSAQIVHLGGASANKHGSQRAMIIDKSYIRFMFKHWPIWKAKMGIVLMVIFYASRLLLLTPQFVLRNRKANTRLFVNHITGLKGLLKYRNYLSKDF